MTEPKPQIWVPGTLKATVDGDYSALDWTLAREAGPATLAHGPMAGWAGRAKLTNWKQQRYFVDRSTLEAADVRDTELEVPFLQTDSDLPEIRGLRRLAETCPILQVSRTRAKTLSRRGVRIFEVGFTRLADDIFWFEATRGGDSEIAVTVGLYRLQEAAFGEVPLDRVDNDYLLERVLVELSDGKVTLRTIAAAQMLYWADHPEAEESLRLEFEQIVERAEIQREDARAIHRALQEAPAHAETVSVPVYGSARRQRHPAFELRHQSDDPQVGDPQIEGVSLEEDDGKDGKDGKDGEALDRLLIPEGSRWRVPNVEPWVPPERFHRVQELARQQQEAEETRRRWARLVGLLLIVALVVFFTTC